MNAATMRPASVTVLGVLNIVFGVLGLLGIVASAIVQYSGMVPALHEAHHFEHGGLIATWTNLMLLVGIAGGIGLTVSGIGLLRLRHWGRTLALIYVLLAVVSTVATSVMQSVLVIRPLLADSEALADPEVSATLLGAIFGVVGSIIGLIYPLLLWYFLTRPRVVAAFDAASAIDAVESASSDPPLQRRSDLANPYSAPATQTAAAWPPEQGGPSVVEAFIPTKNSMAIASYYLGLFSLFPCLGLPLGVTAVYFGIQGLKRVRQTPEARGGVHAWVGIVCGALFGFFNLLLVGMAVLGLIAAFATDRR